MPLVDTLRTLPNASSPLPWLVTAGQPGAADFQAARDAGVTTVIDIRDPMEPRGLDEPATVRGLGMTYINIPVITGALTDEAMEGVLSALRNAAGTPTLLHCASANRTGGPLIAYLMLDEKIDQRRAIDTAMRAGLRGPDLMEWAVTFARQHGA